MEFTVLSDDGQEWVTPPTNARPAGGNSVMIINTLGKPVTVSHGGHLAASSPFTVPPLGGGPPVPVPVAPGSDVSGTVFRIHIEASIVRAIGLAGDPTIIIL